MSKSNDSYYLWSTVFKQEFQEVHSDWLFTKLSLLATLIKSMVAIEIIEIYHEFMIFGEDKTVYSTNGFYMSYHLTIYYYMI